MGTLLSPDAHPFQARKDVEVAREREPCDGRADTSTCMTRYRILAALALVGGCASVNVPASPGSGGTSPVAGSGGTTGGGTGSGGRSVTLPDAGLTDAGTFHADTGEDATCGFESFEL